MTPVERGGTREDLAEQVLQLRHWQHLLNEELKQQAFKIPVHLAFGHEAIAVAIGSAMTADDQLVLTHRNIAYNLARAGDLAPVREEFLGKSAGVGGGLLGSMNLANPGRGVAYASSILGNNLSVGCGLALAKNVLGAPGNVVALTGDGAMEEGPFYEALVFAKTQGLRVIIVIENNDQSMASTIAERRIPIAAAHLCAAVDIPFSHLSSNDVFEYAEHFAKLRDDMATRPGPRCVEVSLRAFYQHAGPTPGWPTDPKRIDIANGLLVAETDSDPVFVLRRRIGVARFDALEARTTRTEGP